MKTDSIFTVVKVAKNEPRRYGKNGELLVAYDESDIAARRRSSAGGARRKGSISGAKGYRGDLVERMDDASHSGHENGNEKV